MTVHVLVLETRLDTLLSTAKDCRKETRLFAVHGSWTYRTCLGERTSKTAGIRLDSLLSTVLEPTEHVLETEPQGMQEQNWTLCCPQFMNLQYMSWSKKREKMSTWDLSFVTACKVYSRCSKCQTQTLSYVIVTISCVMWRNLVPGFN